MLCQHLDKAEFYLQHYSQLSEEKLTYLIETVDPSPVVQLEGSVLKITAIPFWFVLLIDQFAAFSSKYSIVLTNSSTIDTLYK